MKPQRFSSRTRDLLSSQPGQNGKGSADRTIDDESYRKNYDEICWNRPDCQCNRCREARDIEFLNSERSAEEGTSGESCCDFHRRQTLHSGGADGVTESDKCFCESIPCRCELEHNESAPGSLPAVPQAKHSEVAECGVRSPQRVTIDNSKPGV